LKETKAEDEELGNPFGLSIDVCEFQLSLYANLEI
jgi:hypothetical protein